MNIIRIQTLVFAFLAVFACGHVRGATVIVSDNCNVTGSGSGFALDTGVNRGINPPTTRLTGSTIANLRYFPTAIKPASAFTITSSKIQINVATDPGRFVLSSDGASSYDFSSALGIAAATPSTPVVYDLSISIKNASSDNQRCSFALGTIESDAFSWAFGFQIYRTNSTMTKYLIGKRIDTTASGLAADLNSAITTLAANTFGTEIIVLMRVTDAGAETTAFHSRVQLSLDGGSTWFYDTAADSDLPNGWRLNASGRHIMFDIAPGAGPITFDNYSMTWKSGPRTWTGAGTTGNWSNSTNWGGAVPGNGDLLIFGGSTRTVNTNDLSALTVPWLKFNTGGFAIYGNALTVSSAITNSSGNNTINAPVTSSGALRLQSDAGTLTLGGTVANGGQTLTADGAGNATISGVVSGTGALTKNGAGTLQLSGASANTYSGMTTVNSGTLLLAKTAGVNAVAGNLTVGDGVGGASADVVRLAAADQISTSAVTISASGLLDLNGFNETLGSLSGSTGGLVNLGVGTLTVGDGNSTTYAGSISGTGGMAKAGSGTLTLSSASTFTGATAVNSGVLNVQNATGLGGAGSVSVSSGTALELQGGIVVSAQPLTINGTGTSANGALRNVSGNNSWSGTVTLGSASTVQSDSGTLTISGGVSGGQTLTVDGAGSTTVSGIISGAGALTKNGAGTLQLSGASANTYSGLTTVNSGTLLLAKTAGVNAVAGNLTVGDGVGGASADVVRLAAADQISTSAVTISASGLLDLNGFNETIGSLSGSTGSLINLGAGTLTVGDGNSTTYAGSISGTGSLAKAGSGTLTLSSASTFTGATAVNSGVLNVQNATALGGAGAVSVSSGTALELQGGIAVSAQPLTINGSGISGNGALRNISGNNSWSGIVTLGSASTVQSDSGTLTISGGVSGGQTLSVDGIGNTTISGVVSGAGALTKNDAGTLTLSAANTYTGNTTINSGALTIGSSGSIASSPLITIASGTTLNVSSGFAFAASQTVTREAASGTGTINGSTTFGSGSSLSIPVNGATGAVGAISVTGGLTLNNNTITVNISGGTLGAGSYSLLTYTGTRSGTFNLTPVITGSGLKANLRALIFITPGVVALKVIAVETNSIFRVMTYNIHSGADPVTGNIDTTRVSNFITTNHIDLISLNEVARNMPRSNGRDIIAEISQKTGLPFVFSNNMQGLPAGQEFGNAILSSFPILFRDHRLLPNINGNEQRGWLKAIVDVNGKYVTFESTHLDFHADSTERLMCATNINLWLLDETFPTMICGDFNDTPDSSVYSRMDDSWNDSWTTAGDGGLGRTVPSPGYPNNLNARIDYIWKATGTTIKPTNAFVGYTIEASDHYPVITDFILTSTTNHSIGFSFPFDEGTGTTVTDAVGGLQSDGTTTPPWNTNSPSGHTGDFSLNFNGFKKITVPDPKQIIGPNPFNDDYTLEAWVKLPLNYAPAQRAILFQYERKPGFAFSINTNRTLFTTTFKIKDIASTATVPNDAAWHHVAVVHTDGTDMKFYIDGALSATVVYTNGAGYRTSGEITIGAASEGANWFTGNLDRIRFHNRVLTPAELDSSAGSTHPFLVSAGDYEKWKARYGITDSAADNDGDGQSNYAEYLAGTDPTSATSAFRILDANMQPDGQLTVTWSSIGGKRYRLQYASSAGGPFTDIARDAATETDPAPPGQASTQTFTQTPTSTNTVQLYRVQVIP